MSVKLLAFHISQAAYFCLGEANIKAQLYTEISITLYEKIYVAGVMIRVTGFFIIVALQLIALNEGWKSCAGMNV